jgi:hypothetical protein
MTRALVDGLAVLQRDDAEPSPKCRNIAPEADTAIRLELTVGRSEQHRFDPLEPKVGSFAEYLLPEISGGLHLASVRPPPRPTRPDLPLP